MSGTYRIDGQLFRCQPTEKQWQRQQIGMLGTGEPVYSSYWSLSLSFPIMEFGSGSAGNWLMQHWVDDELHSAVLPHPVSGYLTTFSGVAIDGVQLGIMSFDRDKWVESGRMNLSHISLAKSWNIPNQPEWWIPVDRLIGVSLYVTGAYVVGVPS